MRAFTVLPALVATPLLAGVAQRSQALKCDNQHRSAQGTANAHKGACKPADSRPPTTQGLEADQAGVPDRPDSGPGTPLGTTRAAPGRSVHPAPPRARAC